jgi:hypothetical protein
MGLRSNFFRTSLMSDVHFNKIALIGIGLIGSSLAHAVKARGLADHVAISTRSGATLMPLPPTPRATPIWSSSRCRSARPAPSPPRSARH